MQLIGVKQLLDVISNEAIQEAKPHLWIAGLFAVKDEAFCCSFVS